MQVYKYTCKMFPFHICIEMAEAGLQCRPLGFMSGPASLPYLRTWPSQYVPGPQSPDALDNGPSLGHFLYSQGNHPGRS